jgi:sugar/nucleoside kinase (ribokinase family)
VSRPVDVLAVGEVLVDLVAPDASDLASAVNFIAAQGGAPGNVACAVARLGGRSEFVGAVGRDAFGARLRHTLSEFGVGLGRLRELDRRTSLALAATGGQGPPDFVFYRDADAALSPDDIDRAAIAAASFVYLGSMALQAEPGRSAMFRAIDLARELGTYVSFDPNIRLRSWASADAARNALEPVTRVADVLKVDRHESEILTGETDPRNALRLLGHPEALIVITLGENGCLWRRGAYSGAVAGVAVQAVETTGAGDAFAGALLFRLTRQGQELQTIPVETLENCLRFACAAGALACTEPGAVSALPTYEQVIALIQSATQ